MTETIEQIPMDQIHESKFNPRKHFDKAELAELAESIAAQGVLQPLTVRYVPELAEIIPPRHNYYEIVLGARRFRAAKLAKLGSVPCIVREMDATAVREAQLVENAQRVGVSPLEEAEALAELHRTVADTREIASRIGKSVRYVEVAIQLCALSAPVKKALGEGTITKSHAQELLPLPAKKQAEMVQRLAKEKIPVSKLREKISAKRSQKEIPRSRGTGMSAQSEILLRSVYSDSPTQLASDAILYLEKAASNLQKVQAAIAQTPARPKGKHGQTSRRKTRKTKSKKR